MNKTIFLLFLTISLWNFKLHADSTVKVSKLEEIPIEEVELDYSTYANIERDQIKESNEIKRDYQIILKAKFKLISGDIKLAEFYLNQIDDRVSKFVALKYRYLSLIKFIEGKFQETLKLLEDKKFKDQGPFQQTCVIKIMSYMALNKMTELNEEYGLCSALTEQYSKNDQFWLNILFKLKNRDFNGIKKSMILNIEQTLRDDEMSRLWLKAGLFINKEKDLLELLAVLPESSYSSKKIREIIALMYLRENQKDRALQFVDDIDSANAENIKGNVYLQSKQYELAFGHFKLALQKKSDSENSLERAIPLSWLLNQFEDGLSMLNKVSNKNVDKRKQSAIRIAYLIRLKRFEEAQNELLILKNEFQNIPPFEVNIMDSYVNQIIEIKNKKYDKRKTEESSESACRAFDGLNCWISLSYIQWDNLGKTIKRDEEIITDKTLTIDSLKTKKTIKPLEETQSVDQRDIEELDSNMIKIEN